MAWLIQHTKRAVRIATAVILLLIATCLGFVPGIPGWPLALVALSILAVDFVWAHNLKMKIRDHTKKVMDKIRGKKQP